MQAHQLRPDSVERVWEWLVAATALWNAGVVLWAMLRLAELGTATDVLVSGGIGLTTMAAALALIEWGRRW